MPIRILMLTAACLAFAARAEAGTTWVGAQLQFPVPASDIGDRQLGVGAGVTLTKMTNTHVGFGADLIYHYWPASTGYESAFDHYLRSTRLEALQGSAWAFTAFQVTGHVKLVAPLGQRYAPWVQIGAGGYRLNLNLDEQRPGGTYTWVEGGSSNISVAFGGYGALGLDFHASAPSARTCCSGGTKASGRLIDPGRPHKGQHGARRGGPALTPENVATAERSRPEGSNCVVMP